MPTLPKPLTSALPLALLALLLPGAAFAQGQNAITAVAVRDGNVEIVATQPPNFTTFTMSDPTRLVVDVAGSAFQGVADEIAVNNGVITTIKNASYGTGSGAVARITIGFTKDVETDIGTNGNTLVIKLGGGEDVAAAAPATPPAQAAPAAAAPAPAAEVAAAEPAPAPAPAPAAAPPAAGNQAPPAPAAPVQEEQPVAAAEPPAAAAPVAAAAPPPVEAAPPPPEPVAQAAPPPPAPQAPVAAAPPPPPVEAAPPPPEPVAQAAPAP
ncbi:MAG: AMIN domain-containing protein, partial [Deltaproteobacteria bacterium]